jgi:very-short-patch-repair endonuclease
MHLLAVAARQHGMVTTAQLAEARIGRRAVARRIAKGWLVPQFRGVYQVGPVQAPRGLEMAAVLATGPGSLLSHDTAAALWGFRPLQNGPIHVTTTRDRRPRPGIRTHRTTRIHSLNAAVLHGLPLTGAQRTLQDLRTALSNAEHERATEQAEILGLIEHQPGIEPALTRSEAERQLLRLVRKARLPMPQTNVRLHGCEVDFLWAAQKLVVEVDGFAYHRTRQAFERDRRRDAQLAAAGYTVVRFTWRQITEEPEAVVAQLAVLLRRA